MRRTSVAIMCHVVFFSLTCGPAWAQAPGYPVRPIRMIVGGAPGGGWDLASRLLAEKMQVDLGQPVVVDNKPGADGIIAANLAAKAPPDGYTLMPAVSAQMTMNPVLHAPLSYSPLKDFEPISLFGLYPLLVVVNPALPVTSLNELIAYAKARPDRLNYAGGSSGFTFAMEVLKQETGMDVRRIPYKGSAAAVAAVLAGDVQMAIVDAAPALPHVRAGKLRALAVTSARRVSLLPDVPSVAESAVPGYEVVLWIGMFAPAGTSAEIVARLQQVVGRALDAPDVRERMLAAGIVPTASTPQALRDAITRDIGRISALAQQGRLSAE